VSIGSIQISVSVKVIITLIFRTADMKKQQAYQNLLSNVPSC